MIGRNTAYASHVATGKNTSHANTPRAKLNQNTLNAPNGSSLNFPTTPPNSTPSTPVNHSPARMNGMKVARLTGVMRRLVSCTAGKLSDRA